MKQNFPSHGDLRPNERGEGPGLSGPTPFFQASLTVLVRGCIVVKRHNDQGNSYKGKHLIGASLQVQRFSPLSSKQEHGRAQIGLALEEGYIFLRGEEARTDCF